MNSLHKVIKYSRKLIDDKTASNRDANTVRGEIFTLVQPHELPSLDSTHLLGGSEQFTNYRVEWRGRTTTIQQFQGAHAQDCFEEHLAIIRSLKDSSVPVGWLAGVSSGPSETPFILYDAPSILNDLKPLVKASLKSYVKIPKEHRAADRQTWSKANNVDNFFRHLDPVSFRKILD